MATANDNRCDRCDASIADQEECPLVVYISAHRIGGPGFLDPTGLSAGLISLVAAQGALPRLELDAKCATELVRFHPEVTRVLNREMLLRKQISPDLAEKREAQADAEHEAYIRAEYERLGLASSTPKKKS